MLILDPCQYLSIFCMTVGIFFVSPTISTASINTG
jgi:hypothetical protein